VLRTRYFVMIFWASTVCVYPSAHAQGIGTIYDMSRFLNEPYPLTLGMGVRWKSLSATPAVPALRHLLPAHAQPRPASHASAESAAKSSHRAKSSGSGDGWLSEVRVGALKHAASLVGNTTKETGIDGNLEILLQAPSFLELLWSPRPTIGISANSSSTNTDIAYAGLTWEWNPWSNLILDFSLGMALHNGKLKFDPSVPFPANAGRHREFGCRWLFRESFEGGWLFAKRHAVTVMWSHFSHGGLCDDKNQGLDNVGIRYGYRL